MSIIRVFPRRTKATPTDELAFIGEPPLPGFLPEADEVHISFTFSWDLAQLDPLVKAWERRYPGKVQYGGPALGGLHSSNRQNGFTPGRYLRPGYTITSRGCPNACPWCMVPEQEGDLREIEPIPEGHIVQDNNLLACSDRHLDNAFAMLRAQKRAAVFSGGLEAERLTTAVVERLRSVRIREAWLAYDDEDGLMAVSVAIRRLRAAGLSLRQVRCYVLSGFDQADTPEAAEHRCEEILLLGALPFMMLYQPGLMMPEGVMHNRHWHMTRSKWTRPAAMLARVKR